MGKTILILLTMALGLWLMFSAFQIKKNGKTRNGSLGQRVRYEDVSDKAYYIALTTKYHYLVGAGFAALGLIAWLVSSPVVVLFLYLFYAAGINFARAKVEGILIDA